MNFIHMQQPAAAKKQTKKHFVGILEKEEYMMIEPLTRQHALYNTGIMRRTRQFLYDMKNDLKIMKKWFP